MMFSDLGWRRRVIEYLCKQLECVSEEEALSDYFLPTLTLDSQTENSRN